MGKFDKLSKFLSLVLRHNPAAAGISLDEHGWADVDELLAGINHTGRKINMDILEEIVATDQKQRYCLNQDKTQIRANQGHSIAVDVELKEQEPPKILYHGTAARFLKAIKSEGLKPMNRLYSSVKGCRNRFKGRKAAWKPGGVNGRQRRYVW